MKKPRLANHKILIISLLVIILLIIAGIKGYSNLTKPTSIKLAVSSKQNLPASYNIGLTPVLKTDAYVSFYYPEGLSLISTAKMLPTSVDDYFFTAKDVYLWRLGIDISSIPGGQLSQLSSYAIRLNNPNEFKQTVENINGQTITIMSDSQYAGSFSKVAYMTNGNLVASVSLTGGDSQGGAPLELAFNNVIARWKWR